MATLTILGYNTHLFGDPITIGGQFFPTFKDPTRAQKIAERIVASAADIVGLVEVWDDDLADQIINLVKSVFPNSLRPPQGGEPRLILGNGLLILGWQHINQFMFETYSDLAGPDYLSDKGFDVFSYTVNAGGRDMGKPGTSPTTTLLR
ncbi:MAG: endonuclease/exonuclease/phosphatase family protein [Anaerolineae bacterium]